MFETLQEEWRSALAQALYLLEKKQPFDEAEHPRDEDGKWTSGGGSSGKLGPGYSSDAKLINGVIHTSNVYDAQRALFENRKVELSQPKQISTLIKRLGETAAEMAEQGKAAPTFNLCLVTLKGTNVFCADQIGIPRVEMPVIRAGATKDFVKYLEKQGYKVEKDKEQSRNLRATQSEISGEKVAASMARIKKDGFYKRLVVSRDDYILDGHHTWAGQLGLDAKDNDLENDDREVKIFRVDISITKLVAEAEKWTGGKGKKPASEPAKERRFNPSQLRDEWGRWTDGSGGDYAAFGSTERVSTTVPSAAKQGFDPHQVQDLSPSFTTFRHALANPKFAAGVDKLMDRYGKQFLRLPDGATTAEKVEAFVEHAKSNLLALYDAQDPHLLARSATWYRGANKIAKDLATQYGVSPRAVAGVMASLSPQRDWDQNVEMAKRVLDIAVAKGAIPIEGEKAAKTKSAMLDYAKQQLADAKKIEAKLPENPDPKDPAVRGNLLKIENRREMAEDITALANEFEGKTLSEIPGRAQQAIILRFYDEGNADPGRSYAIWNPEGTPSGEVAKIKSGEARQSGWGGFAMTANSLSILADDSIANISAQLGDNHKIRNFYNNIISPEFGRDVTIDTHAVAAALLRPLGGGAAEVKEGLGMAGPKNAETGLKALYALYTEAYRQAAEERSVLPREMQSTAWEALRGLFSPEEKRDVKLEASVNQIWKQYKSGKIDLAEAQKAILARGIKPPRWAA